MISKMMITAIKNRAKIMSTYVALYFVVFSFSPLLYFIYRYQDMSRFLSSTWCNAMFYFNGVFIFLYYVLYIWSRDHQPIRSTLKELWNFFKRNIPLILFFALVLWLWISTGVRGFSTRNVWGSEKSRTGLLSACCYLFYFLAGSFLVSRKQVRIVRTSLVLSGTICSLIIILDYFFLENSLGTLDGSMFFYNRNDLSCWLMMVSLTAAGVVLLEKKIVHQVIAGAAYFFLVVALILSDAMGSSFACVFGLLLAVVVLLLTKKMRWIPMLSVILLTAIAYILLHIPAIGGDRVANVTAGNLQELSNGFSAIGKNLGKTGSILDHIGTARAKLWSTAISSIKEHPVFGISKYEAVQMLYENAGNATVHNEYLAKAMDFGIPAAVLLIAFVFSVFLRGARHRFELRDSEIAGLIVAFGYFVGIFVGYDIFYTTPFAMLSLGLGYYRNREEDLSLGISVKKIFQRVKTLATPGSRKQKPKKRKSR